jgi:uncharacterized protein YndB with AHSA1/START domain
MPINDRIVKSIEINAPRARVWKALTDPKEFGAWFEIALEMPFVPGKLTKGRLTTPGWEHIVMEFVVQKLEEPRLFSFTWHPYAVDPRVDYSKETPTLVEFKLEPKGAGTLLTVTESGFDAIPAVRRDEAFRQNSGGWDAQIKNIKNYVTS